MAAEFTIDGHEEERGGRRGASPIAHLLIVLFGCLLWWADRYRAAAVPSFGPWEFEWSWYLAATLTVFWYFRGLFLIQPGERPRLWRPVVFMLGMGLVYAVLQTQFEYMAQHMFFLNRAQHVVMHHLGPFLIALAWPAAPILRGMPAVLRRMVFFPPLVALVRIVQQPVIAAVLFVGLVALWLVPSIHFRAMLDPWLYTLMNWSMVADGILFWCLVLDPRPRPPAPVSHATRIIVAIAVMFPQIAIGATIALASRDLYGFYDWCGRLWPSIGALDDQIYGGLIIWIPSAMMSIAGLLWAVNMLRLSEERESRDHEEDDDEEGRVVISSSGWTGA